MRSSTSYGRRAQSAVIASSDVTARMMIGYAYVRSSPITPTVRTAGSTAKLCQISRYRPARWISSTTIASACCRISTPLGRDRADDAHREPGPGERLAPHDLLGQAELLADRAHLVLEQVAQRLDELEVHVVGEPADVVVAT